LKIKIKIEIHEVSWDTTREDKKIEKLKNEVYYLYLILKGSKDQNKMEI
jgi:hypothetical protein